MFRVVQSQIDLDDQLSDPRFGAVDAAARERFRLSSSTRFFQSTTAEADGGAAAFNQPDVAPRIGEAKPNAQNENLVRECSDVDQMVEKIFSKIRP